MNRNVEHIPVAPNEHIQAPPYENFNSMEWFAKTGDVVRRSLSVDPSRAIDIPDFTYITTIQPSLNPAFPLARVWNKGNAEAGEVWYLTNYGWIKTAQKYPATETAREPIREQFASYYSELDTLFENPVSAIVQSEEDMSTLKSRGFLDLSDNAPSHEPDAFVQAITSELIMTTQFLATTSPGLFEDFEQDPEVMTRELTLDIDEYHRLRDVETFGVETAAILEGFGNRVSIAAEPAVSVRMLGRHIPRPVVAIPQYEIDVNETGDTPTATRQKTHYYWAEGDQIKRYSEPEARTTRKVLDERFMKPSIDLIDQYLDDATTEIAAEEISVAERQYLLSYLESMGSTAAVYRDLQQLLLEGQKNPAKQSKKIVEDKPVAAIEFRMVQGGTKAARSLCYGLGIYDINHGIKRDEPTITWMYALAPHSHGDGNATLDIVLAQYDLRDHYMVLRHMNDIYPEDEALSAADRVKKYVSKTPFDALTNSLLPEDDPMLPTSEGMAKFHAATIGPTIWDRVYKSLTTEPEGKPKARRKR